MAVSGIKNSKLGFKVLLRITANKFLNLILRPQTIVLYVKKDKESHPKNRHFDLIIFGRFPSPIYT